MALTAVCIVAAGNSWSTWRSVEATAAGSAWSDHHEARMLFWLTWAALAALAAGVCFAVVRWGHRGNDAPRRTTEASAAGGPLETRPTGTASPDAPLAQVAAADVVVDAPGGTRLDWKAPTVPRPLHWTDRLRWALALGWAGMLVVCVLAGAKVSTFDDARDAVASGAVREVTVVGSVDTADGSGRQDLLWREGWVRHRADVTWSTSSTGTADTAGTSGDLGSSAGAVLARDAADVLRDAQPGLVVHRADALSTSSTTFLGWYVPAPQVLVPVYVAGALLLLFLILNVPPTWRLTRWAWFWVGFTPVGAVLFALFAGPTPGFRPPRHPTDRIGGLVAFVVSLLAASPLHWGTP